MTLLEAISPTTRALLNLDFFPVGYAWQDPQFGELEASTVVPACDGETAVKHIKSMFPHLTRVWLVKPQPEPESDFIRNRSFLKQRAAAPQL